MNINSEGSTHNFDWAVVYVMAGIPVDVKLFDTEQAARLFEQGIRDQMNPDTDETGIFEVSRRTNGSPS